jgi:hypothetical protein
LLQKPPVQALILPAFPYAPVISITLHTPNHPQ